MIATVIPNSPPITCINHCTNSAYGLTTAIKDPDNPVNPFVIVSLLVILISSFIHARLHCLCE